MPNRRFERSKEAAFDAYCKKVMRHAARDCLRRMERQRRREARYDEVPPAEADKLGVCDAYFSSERGFAVPGGRTVVVRDEAIADALEAIPGGYRHIVLLSYYLDMPDAAIGRLLRVPRSTVQHRRISALRMLGGILSRTEGGC